MQSLKGEIAQLKEQNQDAKEQNNRNLDVYKTVQKERDALAESFSQAETSIFAPIILANLGEGAPDLKERMILAGNFVSTAIAQAKEIAQPLGINIKAVDSAAKYVEILCRAPEKVKDWKASCIRAGARMTLSLVKAHYDNVDIDLVTSSMPKLDEEGQEIDSDAIWNSLSGFDIRVAKMVKADVFVPTEILDDDMASSESSPSPSEFDELSRPGSPDDATTKPPAVEP